MARRNVRRGALVVSVVLGLAPLQLAGRASAQDGERSCWRQASARDIPLAEAAVVGAIRPTGGDPTLPSLELDVRSVLRGTIALGRTEVTSLFSNTACTWSTPATQVVLLHSASRDHTAAGGPRWIVDAIVSRDGYDALRDGRVVRDGRGPARWLAFGELSQASVVGYDDHWRVSGTIDALDADGRNPSVCPGGRAVAMITYPDGYVAATSYSLVTGQRILDARDTPSGSLAAVACDAPDGRSITALGWPDRDSTQLALLRWTAATGRYETLRRYPERTEFVTGPDSLGLVFRSGDRWVLDTVHAGRLRRRTLPEAAWPTRRDPSSLWRVVGTDHAQLSLGANHLAVLWWCTPADELCVTRTDLRSGAVATGRLGIFGRGDGEFRIVDAARPVIVQAHTGAIVFDERTGSRLGRRRRVDTAGVQVLGTDGPLLVIERTSSYRWDWQGISEIGLIDPRKPVRPTIVAVLPRTSFDGALPVLR